MAAVVQDGCVGEVGLQLMNEMWQTVRESQTPTTGINHWVYLPNSRMFVGVELSENATAPERLEHLAFDLRRYLKHIHLGPYQDLPDKWQALKSELAARGEAIRSPSLEIYGHHCDDASKSETTILIGLVKKTD